MIVVTMIIIVAANHCHSLNRKLFSILRYTETYPALKIMDNLHKREYTAQQRVEHVKEAIEYFDRLQNMIESASHSIHLQMYIFSYDETGKMVMEWLRKAAAKGVSVYLLFDGYATVLSRDDLNEMRGANIFIHLFEPIFKTRNLYFGRRLHHKIVVVDGARALVGSNNINNHYRGLAGNLPWLDMALYLEGSVASQLEQVCVSMWNKTTHQVLEMDKPVVSPVEGEHNRHAISVKISRNDWLHYKNEIWRSYFNLLSKANHSVYLVSSYFLPGARLRRQMKLAAGRGVIIKIITAGLSDVKISKNAERYLYNWLLKNDIQIYEYQRSILHAKLGMRDGKRLTLGSFNINSISTYASMELNLEVRNAPFVMSVQQEVDRLITEDCLRITSENYKQKQNWLDAIIQRVSYNLIRMAVALFTFNFGKSAERVK